MKRAWSFEELKKTHLKRIIIEEFTLRAGRFGICLYHIHLLKIYWIDYNIYTYKSLTGGKYKVIDVISVGAGTRCGIPR